MIEIIWPTLVAAGLAVVTGLIAGVEIVGRVLAFGLADAF